MGYAAVIEEFSTISAKGQTTVPKPVRQALRVDEGDQIAFRIEDGGVTVRRVEAEREDPACAAFLAFLAKDIEQNPQTLRSLSPDLAKHIASLVDGVEFDPDAAIED
jgi:antitoxin PrlF